MRFWTYFLMIDRVVITQLQTWIDPRADLVANIAILFDSPPPMDMGSFGRIGRPRSSSRSHLTEIERMRSARYQRRLLPRWLA